MVDRICISINNRCNLKCRYCHFNEKGHMDACPMDIIKILDNVKRYAHHDFKIGFVGNGEPLLDYEKLKEYILCISDNEWVKVYTITNGTIALEDKEWDFLENHQVNVGFSLDGYRELHNRNRCNSFDEVMKNVNAYKDVTGHYPTFNATVGKESIENANQVIHFFERFGTRITFSRMIGQYGIPLDEYRSFVKLAEKNLSVRQGGFDCTMYSGKCGAGKNNYFFANGKIYLCGNCIDLQPIGDSGTTLYELEKMSLDFDRNFCYKESL
ncbi:MAG: radical SAM protein [Lachnospiraceae bacterium]|nr:radical SAM protein [Lachnospiraceae bacterium]